MRHGNINGRLSNIIMQYFKIFQDIKVCSHLKDHNTNSPYYNHLNHHHKQFANNFALCLNIQLREKKQNQIKIIVC